MQRALFFISIACLCILVIWPGCTANNSPTSTNNNDPNCQNSQVKQHDVTLTTAGTSITVVSEPSVKDCHAQMEVRYFWYHYDAEKMTNEPPIEISYELYPGFFYLAGVPSVTKGLGIGKGPSGDHTVYQWKSILSAGAKDQKDPTVRFQVVVKLTKAVEHPVVVRVFITSYK